MHGVCVDTVILAVPPEELSRPAWSQVSQTCGARDVGLEVLSEQLIPRLSTSARLSFIGRAAPVKETPVFASNGFNTLIDRPFWKLKRVVDFTIALSMAVLLSPVILAAVALALLDVGMPVVFWQQRAGRDGVPLYLYKFRTLQTLSDRRTRQKRDAQFPSSIGRFLRATRLDELPQLWNILAGDMSLIGPRPLLPVDQPKDTSFRLSVRPGITGWAQVCGGKLISAVEKNALDEWYIRHASLQLDSIIAARTIWMVLTGDRRDEKAISMALLERAQSDPTGFAGRTETDDASEPASHIEPTQALSS
jgi:lipopolysaccharide/colanic/teichoic acid biosynthesis glycosyltransferase